MNTILIQHACGPSLPLLELCMRLHAPYCAARGIEYVTSTATRLRPWWQKHWELLATMKNAPDGTVCVLLDSDALIVGDEHIGEAMPDGCDMAGVRNMRKELNSGAMWFRNGEGMRAFMDNCIKLGDHGTSRDHERINTQLILAKLKTGILNRRWNNYGNAAGDVIEPVQVQAFHNELIRTKWREMTRIIETKEDANA